MSKKPPPAPTVNTIGPCPTVIQVSRTPWHCKFTQHLRTTRPPAALGEHDGKISIGGRNITSLRFADDIDALFEEEQGLEALVVSLVKTCTRYYIKISAEKTKLMTNNQWHLGGDHGNEAEVGDSNKFQVPR